MKQQFNFFQYFNAEYQCAIIIWQIPLVLKFSIRKKTLEKSASTNASHRLLPYTITRALINGHKSLCHEVDQVLSSSIFLPQWIPFFVMCVEVSIPNCVDASIKFLQLVHCILPLSSCLASHWGTYLFVIQTLVLSHWYQDLLCFHYTSRVCWFLPIPGV